MVPFRLILYISCTLDPLNAIHVKRIIKYVNFGSLAGEQILCVRKSCFHVDSINLKFQLVLLIKSFYVENVNDFYLLRIVFHLK